MNSDHSSSLSEPGGIRSGNYNAADRTTADTTVVGWREWVSLPALGIPAIKAKVDTGARTSALHALDIECIKGSDGEDWLAFTVRPVQRDTQIEQRCRARLVDQRKVTDSGGHSQDRYVISTELRMGDLSRQIEITLADRSNMLFRMLLGRTALKPDLVVNSHLSYTAGRLDARATYSRLDTGTSL